MWEWVGRASGGFWLVSPFTPPLLEWHSDVLSCHRWTIMMGGWFSWLDQCDGGLILLTGPLCRGADSLDRTTGSLCRGPNSLTEPLCWGADSLCRTTVLGGWFSWLGDSAGGLILLTGPLCRELFLDHCVRLLILVTGPLCRGADSLVLTGPVWTNSGDFCALS
jgi:hypothetical protein